MRLTCLFSSSHADAGLRKRRKDLEHRNLFLTLDERYSAFYAASRVVHKASPAGSLRAAFSVDTAAPICNQINTNTSAL
jgi:hypothetical protein